MSRRSVRINATEMQGCTLIRVEGAIDEKFDARSFAGHRGVVVIDLGGVERITSNGVLHWTNALKSLDASYYCFVNCRPSMLDQFNLVHGFAQRGELVSFFAHFACRDCGHELDRVIDLRQTHEFIETLRPPDDIDCPKCGARAEFDELPEMYFRYVRQAPPPRPPPAVSDAIGDSGSPSSSQPRRFEMKKDVAESVTVFWMSGFIDQSAYLKRVADGVDGLAVLETGELDGMSSEGATGLAKFVKGLDQGALLARVTASLVEPLAQFIAANPRLDLKITTFLVPLRCTGCQADFAADIGADRLLALVAGKAAEQCVRCMHPLEIQWSPELAARATSLPVVEAPRAVKEYLQSHLPSARSASGDRILSSVDPQRLLLGKYKIIQPLGQGGMGEVFLARQLGPEHFEKLVVLKRVRRDRLGDGQSRDLFLKEARIAARLSHPNVVQIFDLERLEDEYLISMEYVNGIDLARALRLSRELRLVWPVEICCRVIAELCSALHAAHTNQDSEARPAPIIHCDVSPSNILLSTEGSVKLADFGIARIASDPSGNDGARGKAGYAAPEQCDEATRQPDERADIYAVGVVLYECLTLRPIYAGPTMNPVSGARAQERPRVTFTAPNPGWRLVSPPQICAARSGTPPLLQDVFESATHPDPKHRYSNARDLGRDVERIGRLVAETTAEDLALWVKRLIALRLESDGHVPPPIVTLSGSPVSSIFLAGAGRD